jgi:hypothetical protein
MKEVGDLDQRVELREEKHGCRTGKKGAELKKKTVVLLVGEG